MKDADPPPPDRSTTDLVVAATGGDVRAFGRLVERYEARVRAIALALGLDAATAEDVAQDAFTAAFAGLGTLAEPAAFPAWIAGIARNRAISLLRRRGIAKISGADVEDLPVADPHDGPPEALSRETLREAVRSALLALDERMRLALTLRHHAGLTYAEIAETMAVPSTTIKGLLERGTRALRERLASAASPEARR